MSHVQWVKDRKVRIYLSVYKMLCMLSFNPSCFALCRFIHGRYSLPKAETFVKCSPEGLALWLFLCKWLVVSFRGLPLICPDPQRTKKGHYLPSLLPCHSLPCLAVTPLLDSGDLRNPCPDASCWSGGRISDMILVLAWDDHRHPGEEGPGSLFCSFSLFK